MCDHFYDLPQLEARKSRRPAEQQHEALRFSATPRPHSATTALFRCALAAILVSIVAAPYAAAQAESSQIVFRQTMSESSIAPESAPSPAAAPPRNPYGKRAAPANARANANQRLRASLLQARSQAQPPAAPQIETLTPVVATNACAPVGEKPLGELGIAIALPTGRLPADPASECWNQLNASAGPLTAMRCWPTAAYNWTAPCTCHRPLYFEQINLERHGYGCCESLQPLASAAHFFGTVPALPYLMAADCPCECNYTLGHYRPGSCPPWRHHWPSCSPLAAAAQGGVLTGLIFLIP